MHGSELFFAAIHTFVDTMLLAQGAHGRRCMFALDKQECFEELKALLMSLPATSHDTNQSSVFYTESVIKALRQRKLKRIIGQRITYITKKYVREPGLSFY